MPGLLALLLNPKILGVIAIAGILAFGGIQTLRLSSAKANLKLVQTEYASLRAQEAAAAAHSAQVVHTQQAITKAVTGHQAAVQTHIVTITKTLIQQVPYAVPPPVDVFLNNGFVRLADASALGLSPTPPTAGKPDDSPSAVKASDALRWAIDNDAECHTDAARLSDLQDWIRQVEAVH